jgi:hypothetical protein
LMPSNKALAYTVPNGMSGGTDREVESVVNESCP